MAYWLAKTEPGAYSWEQLVDDGGTYWDGVRNYQARNNIRAMAEGDRVLIYHSVKQRDVVGIAMVTSAPYRDPSAADGDDRWSVVDLVPERALVRRVNLSEIKADPSLQGMALVRQSRLSVSPVAEAEYRRILELGGLG